MNTTAATSPESTESSEASAPRPRTRRGAEMWLIGGGFLTVALVLWIVGIATQTPILRFAGLMSVASTFIPLPADSYVLGASLWFSPLVVALVGGAINAVAVLVERSFLRRILDHPRVERVRAMTHGNRYLAYAERSLFLGLVVAAASPLPFEVFRLLAVDRNYPPVRYAIATFIGRGTRFYFLASAGVALAHFNVLPWVIGATLAIFAIGLINSMIRNRRSGRVDSPDEVELLDEAVTTPV